MRLCGRMVPRARDEFFLFEGEIGKGACLCDCLLPEGHDGPHEFKLPDGITYCWEWDEECRCEDCMSNQDPQDACYIYWRK